MATYQAIVLSGGGSKGAFGVGALSALEKYHFERKKSVTKIYCGTSVGALNAMLAAQGELQKLRNLYDTLTTADVLGTKKSEVGALKMLRVMLMRRRPFHYFRNDALKKLIEKYANFALLKEAHLLICATNFTTGDLETFYASKLIDEFREKEDGLPAESRRLIHYHRIESQEDLVNAVLASTAIPFYLPPIKIKRHMYIDGGIGNNTPLRQAAYVCRFLNNIPDAAIDQVLCVINDPSRFTIDDAEKRDVFGVIRRTMDIFNNELVRDSQFSWERINANVSRNQQLPNLLDSQIEGFDKIPKETLVALKQRLEEVFRDTGTSTTRRQLPLLIVRPSTPIADDILKFDPEESKRLRKEGAERLLDLLHHRSLISYNNFVRWNEEIE